jgi:hypothetical protein
MRKMEYENSYDNEDDDLECSSNIVKLESGKYELSGTEGDFFVLKLVIWG